MKKTEIMRKMLLTLLAATAFAAAACSVKEDRRFCPFELTVSLSLSDRPSAQMDSVEVAVCNGAGDRTARIAFSERDRGWREFDIERGKFTVWGVFNRCRERLDVPSHRLMIPFGMQSDSIYAFSSGYEFDDEKMAVYPVFFKQWATVVLISECSSTGEPFFEKFEVKVVSDTEGLDLMTLEGIEGRFGYLLQSVSDRASVRLPRQCGDGLRLEIRERTTGGKVLDCSLSERLEEIGYDWTAPDLEDICLVISEMADCNLVLDVRRWKIHDIGEIEL